MPFITEYTIVLAGFGFLMLLHGTLAAVYLISVSVNWRGCIDNPAKLLVAGFILSVAINVALIYLLDALSIKIEHVTYALLAADIILIYLLFGYFRQYSCRPTLSLYRFSYHDYFLLFFLVFMFAIMVRNGAAIDTLTDAWWHMSIINKMSYSQEIAQDIHPLTGSPATFEKTIYPPFWHVNLAVLHPLVKQPIPLIWMAGTAFITVLTVLAFYCFSLAILRDKNTACLSVVLFAFLTGGLNTYHRVLAWPSNVSILLLYAAIGLIFSFLSRTDDHRPQASRAGAASSAVVVRGTTGYPYIVSFLLCCFLMLGIHTAALFWTAISFFSYALILPLIRGAERFKHAELRNDAALGFVILTLAILSASALFLYKGKYHDASSILIFLIPILVYIFVFIARVLLEKYGSYLVFDSSSYIYGLLIISIVWLIVDIDHIRDLLRMADRTTSSYYFHVPKEAIGVFDLSLKLPKWEHQLRGGLLPTGLLAVALSIWLFFHEPGRGTAFLFANGIFALLALSSPYLFSWYELFIPATSVYRIHLLIFSPLIFASALASMLRSIFNTPQLT